MMHHNKMVAVVKVDGKVLREAAGTVYLPFGSNYSLLLKNLNTQRAKVNITIDNEDILDGDSIIINGNSDLELKRWLVGTDKTGPALKFIEKTDELRDIVGENDGMDGIIRITYQYEQTYSYTFNNDIFLKKPNIWYDGAYTGIRHFTDGTIYSNVVMDVNKVGNQATSEHAVRSFKNEDGMTVKGEEVDQEFRSVVLGALEPTISVISLVLKGGTFNNNEAVTVKTVIKCDKCKTTNPWSANFCAVCGNNLKYSK